MTKIKLVVLILIFAGALGCSKQESKQDAKEAAPQKIVLEMGDYQLTSKELEEILHQLPLEQKAKYLGRGKKGKEELITDIAEKQLLALAARDRKLQDQIRVQTGLELAHDSVLYSAYYREEILNKAIPETEIRAFYDQNKDKMMIPEQVKIRQIFVSPKPESEIKNSKANDAKSEPEAKQKIEMLQAEIKKGIDFGELAKQFSEDPNAPEGGEMPWFGRGRMVKAFEDISFSLQPGQVSEPLKTEFGFYMIQLVERRQPSQIPYEDVRDQIQNQIANDRKDLTQKMYDKIVLDLEAKYPKKIHLENLEP